MADPYWLSFAITSTILSVLWIISFKQCCNTDISDKSRCHRASTVVIFNICAFILNAFYYLSAMDRHLGFSLHGFELSMFTLVFEAIVTIIGFHLFCLFHLSFIDSLYEVSNDQSPRWIKRTFRALQVFVCVMAIICYSFVFVFIEFYTIVTFYILYAIIILFQSLLVLYEARKLLKLLNISQHHHPESIVSVKYFKKLQSATRTIRTMIFVLFLICIVCVVDILFNVRIIRYGMNGKYENVRLGNDILRSSFIITMMMMLVIWTYQKDTSWCFWNCRSQSVCMCIMRCSEYKNYIVITSPIRDKSINGDLHKINLLDTPSPINLSLNTDFFDTPRTVTHVTTLGSIIDTDSCISPDSDGTTTLLIAEDTVSTNNTV